VVVGVVAEALGDDQAKVLAVVLHLLLAMRIEVERGGYVKLAQNGAIA